MSSSPLPELFTPTVVTVPAPHPTLPVQVYLPALTAASADLGQGPAEPLVLAQFDDVNVLDDMTNAWNGFVESGQIWALIIGVVIGYLVRGLTSY